MKNNYYDSKEGEFAAAVAATAFAIASNEEVEEEKMRRRREEFGRSKKKSKKVGGKSTQTMPRTEEKSLRRSYTHEVKIKDESSTRKPLGRPWEYRRAQEIASSSRRSGLTSAASKTDSWEKAQNEKIRKWYEKMKVAIVAWENEKKLTARLRMEKRKSELERRREINNQHYRSKLSRIEIIAGGAKQQLEEKRRNEEAKVREKAKTMRRTGKISLDYFCFRCY